MKVLFLFLAFFISQPLLAANNFKIIYTGYMRDVTKTDMSGAYANLSSLLKHYRNNGSVLFLFGGNSLGPSVISNMDKGIHIVDILNTLEPDCYGVCDSDFSYSVEEFSLCAEEAVFPFVLSNTFYKNGEPIEGTVQNMIAEKSGVKVGIISILDENIRERYLLDDIVVKDLKNSIEKNAKMLREQGAKIIILLKTSYVGLTNDILDNHTIDLILSKDLYPRKKIIDTHKNEIVLKDFKEIAVIDVREKNGKFEFSTNLDLLSNYPVDKNIENIISRYEKSINAFLSEQIGRTNIELNTQRTEVRNKENLFANFVADAIKDYTNADIAFINGGIIRGGKIYKKGDVIKRKDIFAELPFRNKVVLLEIEGKRIFEAFENGLSLFEENDGRFLHVSSGIKLVYDTSLKPNNRVKKIFLNGKELQKDKLYKLATSDFTYKGGDNFDMLKDSKQIKLYKAAQMFIYDIVMNYMLKKKVIDLDFEYRLINLSQGK